MPITNVDATPMRAALPGRRRYRQLLEDVKFAQKEHADEMLGHWIGPYHYTDIFHQLMHVEQSKLDKMPTDVKFELPVRKDGKKLEKHLYQLFETTIRDSEISPNFGFFIGADGRPKAGDVRIHYRPDGGIKDMPGPPPTQPTHNYNFRTRTQQKQKIEDAGPDDDKTGSYGVSHKSFDWFEDGLVIEFKKSSTMDPFYTTEELKAMGADKKPEAGEKPETGEKPEAGEKPKAGEKPEVGEKPVYSFAKLNEDAARIRGQLAIYATQVFDHQHRTHLFQILVCGRHARFIYWDHSGAIVSDLFDYIEEPLVLTEFFWRYNHMSLEERGWDLSVERMGEKETKLFRDKVTQLLKNMDDPKHPQRKLPRAERTLDPAFPVYKISVYDDVSHKYEDVLIQCPFVRIHSALGRATRGYLAYVLSSDEIKFLKDTWRVVHDRLIPERTLCRELEQAKVPSIPKNVFGGDANANAEREKTRCLDWAKKQKLSVVYMNIRNFRHHRLLQEIAYPVDSAPDSRHYVIAFRDCFPAIKAASKLCGVLHRDISLGNVMLKGGKFWGGILADWDHAAKILLPEGSSYQNFRTGTWQFMSVGLLKDPRKPHDILDDIESLYWSLLHGALHRFRHGSIDFNMEMFDEQTPKRFDGKLYNVGGTAKRDALGDMHKLVEFDSAPLNTLIRNMAKEFHMYYNLKSAVDAKDLELEELEGSLNKEAAADEDEDEPAMPLREEELLEEDPDLGSNSKEAEVANDTDVHKEFEQLREKLSEPSFWTKMFDEATKLKGWKSDATDVDRYAPCTAKQAAQNVAKSQLTSHLTGEQLALQDGQTWEHMFDVEEAAAMRKAAKIGVQQEQNNIDSDDDDDLESCINVGDIEERQDPLDAEFQPIPTRPTAQRLASSSSAAPSGAMLPPPVPSALTSPHHPPPASHTMSSIQSMGSIRTKRSIDETDENIDTSEEPAEVRPPPPKKSRSRSRPKPEPTTRVTRSSSKLSQPLEEAAVAATATKGKGKGKQSRARSAQGKARSGDLGATASRPRREGLRSSSRTTSTHHD